MAKVSPLEPRFNASYSVADNGCWIWIRGRTAAGYGQITHKRKVYYAHRISYEITHGRIADGLEVCHKCDNPPCVNPDHLFVGTHKQNFEDASSKNRMSKLCGIASPSAKLTNNQVISIRQDGRPHRTIAKDYGISNRNVSSIKRRETWGHI